MKVMRVSTLLKMDLQELNTLQNNVTEALKLKAKQTLQVGMNVMVDSPKADGVYTIEKIARKKATIKDVNGKRYTATMTMLIPV